MELREIREEDKPMVEQASKYEREKESQQNDEEII